jgi:hypothetical protein
MELTSPADKLSPETQMIYGLILGGLLSGIVWFASPLEPNSVAEFVRGARNTERSSYIVLFLGLATYLMGVYIYDVPEDFPLR